MATIHLSWDNGDVDGVSGLLLRASKRIKTIGGGWDTSDFTPSNDIANTENEAVADVVPNKVYEFKVESICSGGGITPNLNGIIEQIAFECPEFIFVKTHNTLQVTVNTADTDFTKVRVVLHLQSDDSVVDTKTPVNAGSTAVAFFTGLTPETDYYFTIEMFAMVNNVEVVSSDSAYLNQPCVGEEYAFTSDEAPDPELIPGGVGNSVMSACANDTEYYISDVYIAIQDGVQVYVDSGLTTPLTGYSFIKGENGEVYNMNPATGVVGELAGSNCGGEFKLNNTMSGLNIITEVQSTRKYTIDTGNIPVISGQVATGLHGTFDAYDIDVTVSLAAPASLQLYINGIVVGAPVSAPSSGTYTIPSVSASSSDDVEIRMEAVS